MKSPAIAPLAAIPYNPLAMPFVEGYLNTQSAAPGEMIELFASSNAGNCSLRIVREGAPKRIVHEKSNLSIGEHPVPAKSWVKGTGYPACWRFTIPNDWPTGVYRVELRAAGARRAPDLTQVSREVAEHDILLVIRATDPAKQNQILLQLATNTYAAYNPWGGHSLYAYHSLNKEQATAVSLLRPGHGYHSDSLFTHWERPFIHFCQREGIALDYATNYDLHTWHEGFDDYRLIVSVGHDEYWSASMRDHMESFVANGGNAAFFSGNTVCWQVRFEDEGRRMVCFKETYQDDPHFKAGKNRTVTTLWSNPVVGRPENELLGVGFRMGGYHRSHGVHMEGSGAFTVRRPDHWVFEGTRLKAGDMFGGPSTIVGYECDGCYFTERDGLPFPTGEDGTPKDFTILAQGDTHWTDVERALLPEGLVPTTGRATLGLHSPNGAVFTTGTTDWAHGLADDPAVQQITRNVLRRQGAL